MRMFLLLIAMCLLLPTICDAGGYSNSHNRTDYARGVNRYSQTYSGYGYSRYTPTVRHYGPNSRTRYLQNGYFSGRASNIPVRNRFWDVFFGVSR